MFHCRWSIDWVPRSRTNASSSTERRVEFVLVVVLVVRVTIDRGWETDTGTWYAQKPLAMVECFSDHLSSTTQADSILVAPFSINTIVPRYVYVKAKKDGGRNNW
jgi:hypothetical protein